MENEAVDYVCVIFLCDKVSEWIGSTKQLFETSEKECERPTKPMQL